MSSRLPRVFYFKGLKDVRGEVLGEFLWMAAPPGHKKELS